MRPSSAESPPPRCDMWIVEVEWRLKTPGMISRIVAFCFLGGLVAQAGLVEIGAHAGGAGEEGNVDAGLVHHADMLVEIEQHPVQNEAGCAVLVVGDDLAPAEILRHQFARREVVLEIDDHRTVSPSASGPCAGRARVTRWRRGPLGRVWRQRQAGCAGCRRSPPQACRHRGGAVRSRDMRSRITLYKPDQPAATPASP